MSEESTPIIEEPSSFADLGLRPATLKTLSDLGYQEPTPIQLQTIAPLLAGRDVVAQAQTGTGKTAAFALPLLERIDSKRAAVQALILTPTRELALQVSEAIHTYSKGFERIRIAPIYGGQPFPPQARKIAKGAQIVVGTPGRVMDHMRRGTLRINDLRTLVLDEADEMLRMGFIDDVEWILGHTPKQRQTALFSATLSGEIRRIAERYTTDATRISIAADQRTLPSQIKQVFWPVSHVNKLDALRRIVETENIEAGIIFARTKAGCAELASALNERGTCVEPLHGDLSQPAREQVVRRLKSGAIRLIVATDVAARGLDIERVSHVINYDIPGEVESYVHRIGRTGRAGSQGKAILFVAPRERWMLKRIEKATGQRIAEMRLPTRDELARHRANVLKTELRAILASEGLEDYLRVITELESEGEHSSERIAAAALRLARGEPALAPPEVKPAAKPRPARGDKDRGDKKNRPFSRKGKSGGPRKSSGRGSQPKRGPKRKPGAKRVKRDPAGAARPSKRA